MKKLYVILFSLFFAQQLVVAQCTPQPGGGVGFVSPLPQDFPCVERSVAFSNAVTLDIPASVNLADLGLPLPLSVTVSNITITNITGLPAGMSYACNPGNCVFLGGQAGCINFSGTTNDPAGQYTLAFDGTVTVNVPPFPPVFPGGDTTVPLSLLAQSGQSFGYDLRVIEQGAACSTTGIETIANNLNMQVYPNPSQGMFEVSMTAGSAIQGELVISDAMGRVVYRENVDFTDLYRKQIDLNAQPAGLYNVSVRTAKGVNSTKLNLR